MNETDWIIREETDKEVRITGKLSCKAKDVEDIINPKNKRKKNDPLP